MVFCSYLTIKQNQEREKGEGSTSHTIADVDGKRHGLYALTAAEQGQGGVVSQAVLLNDWTSNLKHGFSIVWSILI